MYRTRIYLKGDDEPIEVSIDEGKQIEEAFENKSIPGSAVITIKGTGERFLKSMIKRIKTPLQQYNAERGKKNEDEDFIKERTAFVNQTPEEKSQNTNLFEFMWYGFTQKVEVPKDVLEKAIALQLEFFKKYPRRMYIDPMWYREIIPGEKSDEYAIRIIERVVQNDVYLGGSSEPRKPKKVVAEPKPLDWGKEPGTRSGMVGTGIGSKPAVKRKVAQIKPIRDISVSEMPL